MILENAHNNSPNIMGRFDDYELAMMNESCEVKAENCKKEEKALEWPSWFQSAIQERLEDVSARIQFDPSISAYRAEEKRAFEALLASAVAANDPEFAEWEDKHHYRQGLENERLYLQGMRDGAKLVMVLLSDSRNLTLKR